MRHGRQIGRRQPLARSPPPRARGMRCSPYLATLVTLGSLALRLLPGRRGAGPAAVALAAVTGSTDEHQRSATGTEQQPRRGGDFGVADGYRPQCSNALARGSRHVYGPAAEHQESSPPDGLGSQATQALPGSRAVSVSGRATASRVRFAGLRPPLTQSPARKSRTVTSPANSVGS